MQILYFLHFLSIVVLIAYVLLYVPERETGLGFLGTPTQLETRASPKGLDATIKRWALYAGIAFLVISFLLVFFGGS